MRRFLLASLALAALALAAPLAGAQYPDPTPTPPAYETPMPDPNEATTDALAPPVTPQTTEAAPPVAPDPYVAQTDPYAASTDPTVQAQTDTYDAAQAPDACAQTDYAAVSTIDLTDEAMMAGMDGVPMTAAEVCAPRSVSLTDSGSRLNRDARRHLINAADYASVCEVQRVVIRGPNGRTDAALQTLAEHGVDDSLIEVEQSVDGGLGMELTFAGVAASSEQYAAMFNGVQTASLLTPGEAYAAPSDPGAETDMSEPSAYEPTVYTPDEPVGDEPMTSEPTSYQPPVEDEMTPSPIY